MALPNFKFHQDVVTSMCYSTYAGSAVTIDHENIVKAYSVTPSMLGRGHTLLEPNGPIWVKLHPLLRRLELLMSLIESRGVRLPPATRCRSRRRIVPDHEHAEVHEKRRTCCQSMIAFTYKRTEHGFIHSHSSSTRFTSLTTAARSASTGCWSISFPRSLSPIF